MRDNNTTHERSASACKSKRKYYAILLFVVFVWGLDPIIMSFFYKYYSATMLTAIGAFSSLLFFLILSLKKLGKLDSRYLRTVVPISLLNSVACLLQKIGLQYTTPANYAFLEHISSVIVPIAVWVLMKKRPSLLRVCSSVLCLAGCFILCGSDTQSGRALLGDVLCASAGVLLGVCIAAVAAFAVGLDQDLYMCIYMSIYFLTSAVSAPILNYISINGEPMEMIRFSFSPPTLILAVLFGLLSIGICWMLRNTAILHTGPNAVAVISPLTAVVSGSVSVFVGLDRATPSLMIGGVMILTAIAISEVRLPSRSRPTTSKKR